MMRRLVLILAFCANSAAAQSAEETQAAVTNMWLALKTCLDHAAAPEGVYAAMQAAGFDMSRIHTGGVAELHAFGVQGVIAPFPDAAIGRHYCTISSTLVPQDVAEASMAAGAQAAYPNADVAPPDRLYRAACHHMRITLAGTRYEIAFASMNGDGGCGDGLTTEIQF